MNYVLHHKDGSPANAALEIIHGEAGPGGAPHVYAIDRTLPGGFSAREAGLHFAAGDRTGLTDEALLAVMIHRLEGVQAGSHACEMNRVALNGLRQALGALQARTAERTCHDSLHTER